MNEPMDEYLNGLLVIERALCDAVASAAKVRLGLRMQPKVVWNHGVAFGMAPPESVHVRADTDRGTFSVELARVVIEDCWERLDRPEAAQFVSVATEYLLGVLKLPEGST